MKKAFSLLILCCSITIIHAQESLPIKQGTILKYSVTVGTQTFPMFFHLETLQPDKRSLAWNFEDGRAGRFITDKASIDAAGLGYWNQPIEGEEIVLPASQNVLFLSRLTYSTLQANKKGVFDDYTVTVKPAFLDHAFILNGKRINTLYMDNGAGTKIWVLNDPANPLILKIEGNPYKVDAELTGIE